MTLITQDELTAMTTGKPQHRLVKLYAKAKAAHGPDKASAIVRRVYQKCYAGKVKKYEADMPSEAQVVDTPPPAPAVAPTSQQAMPPAAHRLYSLLIARGHTSLQATKIAMKVPHLRNWTGKPKKYCAACDKYDCHHTKKKLEGPAKYSADHQPAVNWIDSLKAEIATLVDENDPLGSVTLPDGRKLTAWKVDGDAVKLDYDIGFAEGSADPKYVPAGEIWIADTLPPEEWKYVVLRLALTQSMGVEAAQRAEKLCRAEAELTDLANGIECSECGTTGCEHVCEKVRKYAVAKYAFGKGGKKQLSGGGHRISFHKDEEGESWITLKPHGKAGPGVHVKIDDDTDKIVAGPKDMVGNTPDDPVGEKKGGDLLAGAGSTEHKRTGPAAQIADEDFSLANKGPGFKGTDLGPESQGSLLGNEPNGAAVSDIPGQQKLPGVGDVPAEIPAAPAAPAAPPTLESRIVETEKEFKAKHAETAAKGAERSQKNAAIREKNSQKNLLAASAERLGVSPEQLPEIAQEAAGNLNVSVEELQQRAQDLLPDTKEESAYNEQFYALQAAANMSPSQREKIANQGGAKEKDRVGLGAKDNHKRGDVALNINDQLIGSWASEYPLLGIKESDGGQGIADILAAGPREVPTWYDKIGEAAEYIQAEQDKAAAEIKSQRDAEAELEAIFNKVPELGPGDEQAAFDAHRDAYEEPHADETVPDEVLAQSAPEGEAQPKAAEKPKESVPIKPEAPQAAAKPTKDVKAEQKKRAEKTPVRPAQPPKPQKQLEGKGRATDKEIFEAIDELKKTHPGRNDFDMDEINSMVAQQGGAKAAKSQPKPSEPKGAPRNKLTTEEIAGRAKTAQETTQAKATTWAEAHKELAAHKEKLRQETAKISQEERRKTKAFLEDAKRRAAGNPELSRAISQWLASLTDELSPMWDIRQVGGALRRFNNRVKSSSPNVHRGTHLPGGRLISGR